MRAHDAADPNDAATATRDRTSDRRALFIVPLLALFILHPLIVHGCSCGHDFDFHLLSWFEASTQISHGTLHPHWAYTPAWDAGEPRFIFYPPLSWYLGALIGLLLTHLPRVTEAAAWTATPIVFTWTALTLSGLAMYRLARRYASGNAALVAAAIYMANPYMLFTAYERTAYGELLAAAWMPLLLDGILRRRITVTGIALPVALLWLTNAPAGVMGCYALALLALVRVRHSGAWISRRGTLRILGGAALGFSLVAFYIVPAAYERRYVQTAMAMIGGMKINANFLFEHTGNSPDDLLHDQVLRTASWIAVVLLMATVAALFAAWRRSKNSALRSVITPLALLVGTIAFLLTPLSASIWHYAPEMAFLQFPWRLLSLLAPVLALTVTIALPGSFLSTKVPHTSAPSTKAVLVALFAAAVLALPAWHLFRQPCDPEDTAAARIALFHSNAGTDPTDEYTPITADNDALQPSDPAYWVATSSDAPAPAQTNPSPARTAPMHLTIDAPRGDFLILNLRDYPAWRITLTGNNAPPQDISQRELRSDGLIAVPVPAGRSAIDIRYAHTADETVGDVISLSALGILAVCVTRRRLHVPATTQPT